jgi:hypothetical protein
LGRTVTGVQTCALPISPASVSASLFRRTEKKLSPLNYFSHKMPF